VQGNKIALAQQFREISSDSDASYERVLEVDVSRLKPTVAFPHLVDNTRTIDEVGDVPVHEVWIGSSANGRLEDFQEAARILKGRKANPGTRLIVTPASRKVLLEGMRDGTFMILAEAGAAITDPGCGPCLGIHEGVLADGDNCLATQPRNFKGRMGNPNSSIYLGSPALAAATAISGKISDPREFV